MGYLHANCKTTVTLNNMLQYGTYIPILTLRNSYKVREHVLGHLTLAFLGLIVILHSPYQGYLSGTVTTTLFDKMAQLHACFEPFRLRKNNKTSQF